ncbi:MAG: HU family DNA-binding protein [Paracoccaceae bacterium]
MATKAKRATPAKAVARPTEKPARTSSKASETTSPPDEGGTAAPSAGTLRARELVAQVSAATGSKKPQVREIVEATLAAMGNALAEGRALNLPPFGKAHVTRTKDRGGAEVMVLKLRRGTAKAAAAEQTEALADAGH